MGAVKQKIVSKVWNGNTISSDLAQQAESEAKSDVGSESNLATIVRCARSSLSIAVKVAQHNRQNIGQQKPAREQQGTNQFNFANVQVICVELMCNAVVSTAPSFLSCSQQIVMISGDPHQLKFL